METRKQAKEKYAKKKLDRNARQHAEIKERALSFAQRMQEHEEKEFGPHNFQLPSELKGIEKPPNYFAPGTHIQMPHDEKIARQMLYRVQQMKACERVLWNKLLPETDAMMVELTSIIEKFEDERAQKAREEEDEKARRAAERERERLERLAATAKPTPEQPMRRWVNGDVIDGQGYKKWS